jgi:putative exporter of polyketide antibiotics
MSSLPPPSAATPNPKGFALALISAAALLSPLIGIAFTARALISEFDQLQASALPATDPSTLSSAVGHVLLATALSYVLSLLGAIGLVLAAHHLHYRAPCVVKVMTLGLILWLPAFPIGTLLGIAGLAVLMKNQAALSGQPPPSSPPS